MKLKRLLAGVVSAAMMLSIGSTLAFAADVSADYDDDTMTFASIMNLGAEALTGPNATYTYTISAGEDATYSYTDADNKTTTSKVYAGITDGITTSDTDEETTDLSVVVNFTTKDTVTSNAISHDVTFDFSGVDFTEPGVYTYIITETQASFDGLVNGEETRYVYVTVKNNSEGTGVEITSILMTEDFISVDSAYDGATVGSSYTKSDNYTHSYGVEGDDDDDDEDTPDVPGTPGDDGETFIVDTTAKGDMANRSKDFSFATVTAVELGDEHEGMVFAVTSTNTTDGDGIAYLIVDSGALKVAVVDDVNGGYKVDDTVSDVSFLLSSSESYTIKGVIEGMNFTVTISDTANDGYDFYARDYTLVAGTPWNDLTDDAGEYTYTKTVDGDTTTQEGINFATVKGADDTTEPETGDPDDDDTGITYDAAFPETGVVLDLLPYVAMVAIAGAFIAFRVVKSAHKDEE